MENRTRLVVSGRALRWRRLEAFLTVEELAMEAGLSLATIKAIEGSSKTVHLRTVRKLAKALRCDPGDLAEVVIEEAS